MEAENEVPQAKNENAEEDHTDSDGDIEGFEPMVSWLFCSLFISIVRSDHNYGFNEDSYQDWWREPDIL